MSAALRDLGRFGQMLADGGRSALLCLGIYGQMVYVDTAAGVVGVKLSSWPVPQDPAMLSATLRAFGAITTHLTASPGLSGDSRPPAGIVRQTQ